MWESFDRCTSELSKLGKKLLVRQQALATAQIYLRRFYSKVEIRRTNPYLLLATALYLACKMEECPQHIRVVVSEARQLWPGSFHRILTQFLLAKTNQIRLHHLGCIQAGRMRILFDFRDEFAAHHPPSLPYLAGSPEHAEHGTR